MREPPHLINVRFGQYHTPKNIVSVFDAHQRRFSVVVVIVVPVRRSDLVQVQCGAYRILLKLLGMDASQTGRIATLVQIDVGRTSNDDLRGPFAAVTEDGTQVRHGTRRHEESSLFPKQICRIFLELRHGRIFSHHIVTDRSSERTFQHISRRKSYGVTTEIDNSFLTTARREACTRCAVP